MDLEQYREIRDKLDTLFTFIIYDYTPEDVDNHLSKQLQKIKAMKNSYKRRIINDRIYSFKTYVEELKTPINAVFLVSHKIDMISIPKKYLAGLREFNVPRYIFKYDTQFDIDFVIELITDMRYRHAVQISRNKMTHYYIARTKKKVHYTKETSDPTEYLEEIPEQAVVYGDISKLSGKHIYVKGSLNDTEILHEFRKVEMLDSHNKLREHLDWISNDKYIDRILFGRDLQKGIMDYRVMCIYCSPAMKAKIHGVIPKEYLNFEIIEIDRLEKGDIYDELNGYKGAIGVTYY